jgi:hypothetical protein
MSSDQVTFELQAPQSGAEDKLIVQFESSASQARVFAAGRLATMRSELVDYEQVEGSSRTDKTWALTKDGTPMTDTHRSAISFDAQKAAEMGMLDAQIDIIAHRRRSSVK